MTSDDDLPRALFMRADESSDALFYREPRLVAHIDAATIQALTAYYRTFLPDGADVLDLMSSWISHLPVEKPLGRVAGLGMNQEELAANPRLTDQLVHDLNLDARLPFADASFDRVMIVVSVQYLTDPVAVLRDVGRVLRKGGLLLVALSHRCFPSKAVRAFHDLDAADRVRLVMQYFSLAGCFAAAEFIDRSPPGADPLWLIVGALQPSDSGDAAR